jgi:hypothetical protein
VNEFTVFGCVGLLAAALHTRLPETRERHLPDTLAQMLALAERA